MTKMETAAEILTEYLESHDNYSKEEWLDLKNEMLGGTETACILGEVPERWNTPYQIWRSKLHKERKQLNGLWLRRGQLLEPLVMELFEEETGFIVAPSERRLIRHPNYPYIGGTPDCIFIDDDGNLGILELKTAYGFGAAKYNEGIPEMYQIQVAKYAGIFNEWIKMFYPDYFNIWDPQICIASIVDDVYSSLFFDYDQNLIDFYFNADKDFWEMYIVAKTPPHVGSLADLRQLYHDIYSGGVTELNKTIVEAILERKRLNGEIKDREADTKLLKNHKDELDKLLIQSIGEYDTGVFEGVEILTYKPDKRGTRRLIVKESRVVEHFGWMAETIK